MSALVPELTSFDERLLRELPSPFDRTGPIDAWELGRRLLEADVPMLLRVLNGLHHLGLVTRTGSRGMTGHPVWRRSMAGHRVVEPPPAQEVTLDSFLTGVVDDVLEGPGA